MTIPQVQRGTAKLDDLEALPWNEKVRKIKKTHREALTASIARFGLVQDIVVNKRTGHIVSGHRRVEVLKADGVVDVPVTWVDIDETEEKALALVLNSPEVQGEFTSGVDEVVTEITRTRPEVARVLRLASLRAARVHRKAASDRRNAAPAREPVSKPGEVYELGPHRLLCGDSTKRDEVAALLGAVRPGLMFTDPPYGVIYGRGSANDGANAIRGDLSTAEIPVSFAVALEVLSDDARLYLCGGTANGQLYHKAALVAPVKTGLMVCALYSEMKWNAEHGGPSSPLKFVDGVLYVYEVPVVFADVPAVYACEAQPVDVWLEARLKRELRRLEEP